MYRVTIRSQCGEEIDETTRSGEQLSSTIFDAMAATCDLGAWSPFDFLAHAVAMGASYSEPYTAFEGAEREAALAAFIQASRDFCEAIGWKVDEA